MLKKTTTLCCTLLLMTITTTAWAASAKTIALKLHADYCGSCKAMAPAYTEIKRQFADKDVLFVTFDFSDEGTKHQSKLLADALGLSDVYANNQKSGKILLLDPDTLAVKGELTKQHSAVAMSSVIDGVLDGKNMMSHSDKGSKAKKGSY